MENKQKAIFKGITRNWITKKRVYLDREPDLEIAYEDKVNEDVIIECNLEQPFLQEGESVFIPSINKTVHISKVVRSINNETIYYTNHIVKEIGIDSSKFKYELIEFENSYYKYIKSLKDDHYDEIRQLEKELYSLKSRKWYQYWK